MTRYEGRRMTQSSLSSTLIGSEKARSKAPTLAESRRMSHVAENARIQWHAILALTGVVFQQTLCWGMIMTFGTILSFYARYLLPTTSKTLLCLIRGVQPFFVLGLSLLWGRLLDAGYHRSINTFATCCLTIGLVGLPFTAEDASYRDGHYWQVLLASIPIGVGQTCYFLAAPHVAKTWYPQRKVLAMGITNSGAAIGGSIWPLMFTQITAKHTFRAAIGTLAGISFVLGVFIIYFSVPSPTFSHRPFTKSKSTVSSWIPVRAFRSHMFLIRITAMCSIYMGILTVPFLIEYWAQRNGIGVSEGTRKGMGITEREGPETVYLVVILSAAQFPGRCLGSTLCDKIRARKVHLSASVMAVILVSAFWSKAHSFTTGAVFASLFGLTLGVMVFLPINDVQDLLSSNRTHLLGQYAGVVYTVASPFVLSGAVISGAIVDHLHNEAAGTWVAGAIGVGAILILLSLWCRDDTWKFDCEVNNTLVHRDMTNVENGRASTADAAATTNTVGGSRRLSIAACGVIEECQVEPPMLPAATWTGWIAS